MIEAIRVVGQTIPLLLFPRFHFKPHTLVRAPPGTIGRTHPSGWTNNGIFVDYLQHFMSYSGASKDNNVLLVLYGPESHKSIAATIHEEHGVAFVALIPNT